MNQLSGGRRGHIEQPKHALSWRTRALRDLPGHRADFDQCRYGATCLDEDQQWRPVKKSTTLLTSKKALQNAMTLICQGDHDHCTLEGSLWLWVTDPLHGGLPAGFGFHTCCSHLT